jgi:hypothetical protein
MGGTTGSDDKQTDCTDGGIEETESRETSDKLAGQQAAARTRQLTEGERERELRGLEEWRSACAGGTTCSLITRGCGGGGGC